MPPSNLNEDVIRADPAMAGAERSSDFVDRTELAQRLGVHLRTIRRLVDRGELPRPCLSVGGRPRWLWSFVVEHCRKRHQREDQLDCRKNRKLK